jgi:transcriptional/translational regulatory protein YebC/TACO1
VLLDEEHGGVELSPEAWRELDEILEKLDDEEDVTNVYHNAT